MIMKDNELDPAMIIHTCRLGLAIAAGTAELAASWMKGGPMYRRCY